MEAHKSKATISIDISSINCPHCNLTFVIFFVDECTNTLIRQVPNSGAPFYCIYCGVDVNKEKGGETKLENDIV